jgi:hypothetical protein
MTHKLKIRQAVVQAFQELDSATLYHVVRLMPFCSRGEPQYLIRCRQKGKEGLVREKEIKPVFA